MSIEKLQSISQEIRLYCVCDGGAYTATQFAKHNAQAAAGLVDAAIAQLELAELFSARERAGNF